MFNRTHIENLKYLKDEINVDYNNVNLTFVKSFIFE